MAFKIYIKDNYFIIDGMPDFPAIVQDSKSLVTVVETDVNNFIIYSPKIGSKEVALADLQNEAGAAYDLTTWKAFYRVNTGGSGQGQMGFSYGQVHFSNNASETVINTVDVYEFINGVFTPGDLSGFTVDAAGKITYTGANSVEAHIVSNFDVTTVANNKIVAFQWFKNGVGLPVSIEQKVGIGADIQTNSVHSDSLMENGDYLELKCTNKTDNTNLTVKNIYLYVIGMTT